MQKHSLKFKIAVFSPLIILLGSFVYALASVFQGKIILPQTFRLGFLSIHYYGITMALAVAGGFYFAVKRAPDYHLEADKAESLLLWLILGGFIGARIYHIFSSFSYYWRFPIDMLKVWNGGLSIYGAVLGGIITLLLLKKVFNFQFSIFNLLDWLAPSVVLGQIIGRFGNFFNYEAFGYPTNLPWKMFVPLSFRPLAYLNFQYFHPWFLYEVLGNAVILFLLLKWRHVRPGGGLFLTYLLLYNSLRFCLEFLRIDSVFIGNLRQNALVSLFLAAVAGGLLIVLKKKHAQIS